MNRVFVDTSAILALLVPSDKAHFRASRAFETLMNRNASLLTTSYVLVETYSLIARRLGVAAVKAFREDFAPLLKVVWVEEALHEKALDLMLERGSRKISVVDMASFLVMREEKINLVFTYDDDFKREGFESVK